MNPSSLRLLIGSSCGALAAWTALRAADPVPALSTEATVSLRAWHDSNLYLQDDAPLATGQTAPAAPARYDADAIAGGVRLSFKSVRATSTWSGSYNGEVFRYDGAPDENHIDHRVQTAWQGRACGWTLAVQGGVLLVDGAHDSPVFNRRGGGPAIGGEPVRARRSQAVSRFSARATREVGRAFVRVTGEGVAQDFRTRHATGPTGYANYVDRAEAIAGVDVGWRAAAERAWFAGVRTGFDRQPDLAGVPLNYSSRLVRVLAGFEGKLSSAVKATLVAGPDWRVFGSHVRTGFARHAVEPYLDGHVTWQATTRDAATFGVQSRLWLSSAGRGAYVDSLIDAIWCHTVSPRWSLSLNTAAHRGKAGVYNGSPRDDLIVTSTLGVVCRATPRLSIEMAVLIERSASGVVDTPSREYHRSVVSLGIVRLF